MLDRLTVSKTEIFERNAYAGKVVLVMCDGIVAILENASKGDFCFPMCLRVMLDILLFIYDRCSCRITGLNAFQKFFQEVFFEDMAIY